MKLAEETCKPVKAGEAPISLRDSGVLAREILEWSLAEKEIKRDYRFRDFREAVAFVNKVAAIAETQDHHPDMLISYNRVRLTLSTRKIGGLSRNDFILAAKIDSLGQPA